MNATHSNSSGITRSQSFIVLLTNTPAKSVSVGHIFGLVGASHNRRSVTLVLLN